MCGLVERTGARGVVGGRHAVLLVFVWSDAVVCHSATKEVSAPAQSLPCTTYVLKYFMCNVAGVARRVGVASVFSSLKYFLKLEWLHLQTSVFSSLKSTF